MKNAQSVRSLLIVFILPLFSHAQLNNGGINAHFGIDGDTRSNYVKYGPVTGSIFSDDWFGLDPSSRNVIDTSNAAYYALHLGLGENLGFIKGMAVPRYSRINNTIWLDAAYGRDYIATSPLIDSNAFTIASKNGDDPNNWIGGATNFPDKNDLVDVFAHMRRDGLTVTDSLWLLTGVSTVGTSGSRYFDIELYKKSFTYNQATGVFNSAGTEAGHTEWLFDASGNIIQTGDMIIAVNYSPGSAPTVDARIWVSQSTFTSVVPAYFNFGGTLDGATASYGYTSVLSKSGTNPFGSGIANFSATPAQDTTFSTPWGTEIDTKVYGTEYQSLQFIEVGLNMTRMGLDPALYSAVGLNPCASLFNTVFFKSRSSNSFTSNMQDFVTPLPFVKPAVMDYSVVPDALSCVKSTGSITLTPNSTAGYYTWQALSGAISGSNSDSSQISVSTTGTYVISASAMQGCPVDRSDTIVIAKDTFPPVASILATLSPGADSIRLIGGDVTASNYPTPFGGSQGLAWNWSGPGGFTSSIQNPVNDTVWGDYQLVATEQRNGCKDTITSSILRQLFFILASNAISLQGKNQINAILLSWQGNNIIQATNYTIERSLNGSDFFPLSNINAGSDQYLHNQLYQFTDINPGSGNNFYRVRITNKSGLIAYSNILMIDHNGAVTGKTFLTTSPSGKGMALVYSSPKTQYGYITLYAEDGRLLRTQKVQLVPGYNLLPIESGQGRNVKVVSLMIEGRSVFVGKMIQ